MMGTMERRLNMEVRRIRAEMRMGRSIFDLPLRVTFYARVSTDQDEQLNSLENQVQYYTELIQSKPNWTFVPGYIDAPVIIGLKQNATQTGAALVLFSLFTGIFETFR